MQTLHDFNVAYKQRGKTIIFDSCRGNGQNWKIKLETFGQDCRS